MLVHILGGTGTVHVAKQGHAYWLELYMSQDTLVHILTGTVHVAKQGHASWNCTCRKNEIRTRYLLRLFDCLAHPNLGATFATDQK